MAGEVPPVETDVPPVETDGAVPPVVAVTLTQGEEISDGITTLAALQETQQTVPQNHPRSSKPGHGSQEEESG